MAKVLLAAIVAVMLSGCGSSYERQVGTLEAIVRWLKIGDSSDQWLDLKNSFGEWEHLAFVFGYWDDYEGCKELIAAIAKENVLHREYRCVPAN